MRLCGLMIQSKLMKGHQNMIRLMSFGLLAAAAMLLLAWCESSEGQVGAPAKSASAQGGDKPAGLQVFYASHSLMWDMPPVLSKAVEAYGIKGHTIVGHQKIGVSKTIQHWNQAEAKNQAKKALKEGK